MNTAKELACVRLGVKPEDVSRAFSITPQLRQIAKQITLADKISSSPLSKLPTNPYYYLHCSGEEDAKKILEVYYSIPKVMRGILPIEAFCLACDVPPLRCLEMIVASCVRMGSTASSMLAAVSHPKVVEKTIEYAMTPDGHSDRQDLHKATGFLPTPKPASVRVNVNQNQSAVAQAASVAPPPEQTIRRMVNRFNDQQLLEAEPAQLGEGQPNNIPAFFAHEPERVPIDISPEADDDDDEE
jgi:hypothetical protein